LRIGESAVIASVGGHGVLRRRLLDMGLTPRTTVMVRKVAPLGDPIELYLRGYELTLRAQDAKEIEIDSPCIACAGCGRHRHRGRKHML
jgi:Fe2+ transport system protein FeoA